MLRGKLKGLRVPWLIEFLSRSRRTGRLALTDSFKAKGKLYFRQGRVVHAESESSAGEKALQEMLSWGDAYFEFQEGISSPQESLTADTQALLMRYQAGSFPS